ncbi:MAG: type I methionyl aminopeptidase, partial [Candidatus Brocadiia bacterium]
MIRLKTMQQLRLMRSAGLILARLLVEIKPLIKAGVTTRELDRFAEDSIRAAGAVPAFRGVRSSPDLKPFPGVICSSINDELVHGIPGETALREGDILKVDVGCRLEGFYADAARTYSVGPMSEATARLVDTTRDCLDAATRAMRPDGKLFDVSVAVQRLAEGRGFSVVRDYVGHGIGTGLHEDPQVPNFVPRMGEFANLSLRPGLVLAIEPMINEGTFKVRRNAGEWTVRTADGKLCA